MTTELAREAQSQMVPGDFAEKVMASLMSMHSELMDEKERRVELYRKLMEREQTVAELRMYVKMLEEKLAPAKQPEPVVQQRHVHAVMHPQAMHAQPVEAAKPAAPSAYARAPQVAPPLPPRVARPKIDGWKTW